MTAATLPSKGLEFLRSRSFDAVILDVMLPEMDGFEVCRTVRRDSEIPIIMLTTRGEVTDRVVGLEIGADDNLPKPFDPRELVARLHTIVKRKHSVGGDNTSLTFDGLVINRAQRVVTVKNREIPLTTSILFYTEFRLIWKILCIRYCKNYQER